jgi:bifunctional DNA primase/polymerase-like protein/AAA domain-containing protein
MMPISCLHSALSYANLGFSVIPLRPGEKTPLGTWQEFQKRKATAEEIKKWFLEVPTANVGIVTGSISALAVIDLDGPSGLANGAALKLNSRLISLTGGGKQLFYKWREGICNSQSEIAEKIDVRGEGGYVVAPPSLHPNGKRYRWAGCGALPASALSDFPFFGKTSSNPVVSSGESTRGWVHEALSSVAKGKRHSTFLSVAGKLRSLGLGTDSISAVLSPYAAACGLEDLGRIVNDISKYQPGGASIVVPQSVHSCGVEEFLEDEEKVEWIVPGIIAKRSVGFVAGLPETQKTWLLIDLAVVCAAGSGSWLNLFSASPCKVLFVDQERFKGETQRRFKAVIGGRGLERSKLRGNLFIRSGTTTRLDLEESFRAFRQELFELKPDLVLIDSWATFHTRNDNDRQEVQIVIERIKQLRNEVGCTFVFIDHESKSVFQDAQNNESPSAFRMVGSVGKTAAAEFVLTVRRYDPSTSTVYHTKSTLASTVPCFNTKVVDTDKGIVVEGTNK